MMVLPQIDVRDTAISQAAKGLQGDRRNFIRLPWRVMSFLRQNARDLIVMDALVRQRAWALRHLLMPPQGGH
ncbi:hypothetical protein IVB11_31700 [Bradyrhizobium sp. 177]|uniref:hypothetical protein n=1 Tax=Bradyrhizobium sp. 177 TaxID=2782647 RepID=UPI001FF849B0|nr:hypothetical protein [Bradyrhizobium sp. 177]MCK1553485.1 hypothetical protein [Bradyrhizobium sp. 177]